MPFGLFGVGGRGHTGRRRPKKRPIPARNASRSPDAHFCSETLAWTDGPTERVEDSYYLKNLQKLSNIHFPPWQFCSLSTPGPTGLLSIELGFGDSSTLGDKTPPLKCAGHTTLGASVLFFLALRCRPSLPPSSSSFLPLPSEGTLPPLPLRAPSSPSPFPRKNSSTSSSRP